MAFSLPVHLYAPVENLTLRTGILTSRRPRLARRRPREYKPCMQYIRLLFARQGNLSGKKSPQCESFGPSTCCERRPPRTTRPCTRPPTIALHTLLPSRPPPPHS